MPQGRLRQCGPAAKHGQVHQQAERAVDGQGVQQAGKLRRGAAASCGHHSLHCLHSRRSRRAEQVGKAGGAIGRGGHQLRRPQLAQLHCQRVVWCPASGGNFSRQQSLWRCGRGACYGRLEGRLPCGAPRAGGRVARRQPHAAVHAPEQRAAGHQGSFLAGAQRGA